jgi:hypothetical protein
MPSPPGPPDATPPAHAERRRLDAGGIRFVTCRVCGADQLLNPARMQELGPVVALSCTHCVQAFRVRRTDLYRYPRRPSSTPSVATAPAAAVAVAAAPGALRPPTPAAGWYPNPDGTGGLRYFDGREWTAHTRVPEPAVGAAAPEPSMPRNGSGPAAAHPSELWLSAIAVAAGAVLALVIVGFTLVRGGSHHAARVPPPRVPSAQASHVSTPLPSDPPATSTATTTASTLVLTP